MRRIKLSRPFIFIITVLIFLALLAQPAFAGYNYYSAKLYLSLGDQATKVDNYGGAVDLYQNSLIYKSNDIVKTKLAEAITLEDSTFNYLLGSRILSKAKTKDDYQKALIYFSKIIATDFHKINADDKIKICNQKITEIAEAEKKAADAAEAAKVAELAKVQAKPTQPQTKSSTTPKTVAGSSEPSTSFFQCRHDVNGMVTWIDCPPDNAFVAKAKTAIETLQTKAPEYYSYFSQWVKGIGWDDSYWGNDPQDCEISSGTFLNCFTTTSSLSSNQLAVTFIRETAASEYSHTLPLGYFDYNDCKNYGYAKMNAVAAIIGN